MASPVLFSTGASPASAVSRNLVEFKAGKMEMRDKMVHPIKKQGTVYLHQSTEDNIMHFCWKDRATGIVEDDLMLFPDDCEFKRVKECTTGRVYVLKMKSSKKNLFFWMQEAQADKDDEHCKKINELLNNPPRQAAASDLSASDRDLQSLLGGMTQEQMAQLLTSNGMMNTNLAGLLSSAAARSPSTNSGASASSTTSTLNSAPHSASSATGTDSGSGPAEMANSLSDFRNLLSGFEGSEAEANALMAAAMAASSGRDDVVSGTSQGHDSSGLLIDLSSVMNSESLAHFLSDQEFLKQIEQYLPSINQGHSNNDEPVPDEQRKEHFQSTVRSQQFRSALSQFCVALQSGQLGPLVSQFGLSSACIEAANQGNLEAFVRALENDNKTKKSSSSSSSSSKEPASSERKTDDKSK